MIGFIMALTIDSAIEPFKIKVYQALQALIAGLGLGAINVAIGSWLAMRGKQTS